jgi:hypothetical protein
VNAFIDISLEGFPGDDKVLLFILYLVKTLDDDLLIDDLFCLLLVDLSFIFYILLLLSGEE